MKKERHWFIEACLADDLQLFYRDYIKDSTGRINQFYLPPRYTRLHHIPDDYTLRHRFWNPGSKCVITGQNLSADDIDVWVHYWYPSWTPVKKGLMKQAKQEEVAWCQSIDCNCNDCAFMERHEQDKGYCKKLNKKVSFIPGVCQLDTQECFEGRRS